MMEETVPSASSPPSGATSRRQTTQQPTQQQQQQTQHDIEDDPRGRRRTTASRLSPTLLLSKLFLIITVLLKLILVPIRKFLQLLFPAGKYDGLSPAVCDAAAKAFSQDFTKEFIQSSGSGRRGIQNGNSDSTSSIAERQESSYSTISPFVETGYSNTIQTILSQTQTHTSSPNDIPPPPLLLIYLHSPFHGLVPSFLTKTFCSDRVLDLIQEFTNSGQLICWGGSVHTADGAMLQNALGVSNFPYLSIVRVHSSNQRNSNNNNNSSANNNTNNNNNNRLTPNQTLLQANLEVHLRLEGKKLQNLSSTNLHQYLSTTLQRYQSLLNEQLVRRLEREQEQQLRQDQDREYREALEADQRRERLKKEEEERVRLEEERKVQEAEEEERKKGEKMGNAKLVLEQAGEEPPKGEPNCARLRLMLPSGQRLERRFRGSDTVAVLEAFFMVELENKGIVMENFQLNCNYPKKALVDETKTLEEEGLCPQAVIMVQDLDA